MEFEPKVLVLNDSDLIQNFERSLIESTSGDPIEAEMLTWNASWREESLKHYLPLGWSFGAWVKQELVGYFLAQPLVFSRGLTQTLWVERLQAITPEITSELVEIAYKLSREKHLQKVLFYEDSDSQLKHSSVIQLKPLEEKVWELKTSKIRE